MKTRTILKYTGIFLIVLAVVFLILSSRYEDHKKTEVKCYDDRGSEIIGLKCKGSPPSGLIPPVTKLLFIGFLFYFLGLMIPREFD